jgi:hypothetical protein
MMKCEECEQVLEEYLDGELDGRATAAAKSHLASCAECANAYDSLLNEQNFYSAYERDVEVLPHVWSGVAARIGERASDDEMSLFQRVSAFLAPLFNVPRFSPALTCALVIAAIALTVGVMRFNGSREVSKQLARNDQINVNSSAKPAIETTPRTDATQPPVVASTPVPANSLDDKADQKSAPQNRKSPANEERKRLDNTLNGRARVFEARNTTTLPTTGEQTPEQLVHEAEQRYIAAIRLLQRDVAQRRSTLDAKTAARFDETLAAIDRSILETRRAVEQHAGDPIAAQYMLTAYAKKVDVLREMARADQ